MYAVKIQHSECQKLLTNGKGPLYYMAEAIPGCISIKIYHPANNPGKYTDGLYNCMIDDNDGPIPLPLIMFTSTVLHYVLLEWQKNKSDHRKASESKLKVDRPDGSNYFNDTNDSGNNASCCVATGRKVLTSPGVADMYRFLMNTGNTLPESYHQRVYIITLANSEVLYPTGGEPNACKGDQHGSNKY